MINTLILIFGLTNLLMSVNGRIRSLIYILSLQGFVLFLMVLFLHEFSFDFNFIFLIFETLVIKTILLPFLLKKILNKNNTIRETEPNIPNFYSLVISSILLFAGFLLSSIHNSYFENITPLFFGISISTILISLFFITTKKKLLTHVIGFAMFENGIFLFSLSIAKEMPMIINLGVLLDIFIAIFILGLLIGKINTVFHESNSSALCNLKDCDCDN